MNIAFYHIGNNFTTVNCLCSSAKKSFSQNKVRIIQLSDQETPRCKYADVIARIDGASSGMFSRMQAYRLLLNEIKEPIVFFDTDILIVKSFDINFSKGPVLCKRKFHADSIIRGNCEVKINNRTLSYPENRNKILKDVYPYVGCFFADTNPDFLTEAINIYRVLPEKYIIWYGDQIALREASKKFKTSTIGEDQIACWPDYFSQNKSAVALHFKGLRKDLMKRYHDNIFEKYKNSDIIFRDSYRSNPSKKGYEIPKTLNPYFALSLIGASDISTKFISPIDLDLGARADILCKIIFLLSAKNRYLPSHVGKRIYRKCILALNDGKGKDNPEKLGLDSYENKFLDLYKELEHNQAFDQNISTIPISRNFVLIDGSHRASIAYVLGLQIPIKRLFIQEVPNQPISNLKSRYKLSEAEYMQCIRVYLRFQRHSLFFMLNPCRDVQHDEYFIHLLSKYFRIDASFNYKLSSMEDCNRLVTTIYCESDWLGDSSNNYMGLKFKSKQIYKKDENVLFLLCSHKDMLAPLTIPAIKDLKELGRSYYGTGFHSIHGTDNQEENIIAFESLILNQDIPKIPIRRITVSTKLLKQNQKDFLDNICSLDLSTRERIVISGGMLLACLEIRRTVDIDTISDLKIPQVSGSHNKFIESYAEIDDFKEMINGKYGIFWMSYKGKGIRFIPINILMEAKKKRYRSKKDPKDLNDLKLIENFLKVNMQ